MAGWAFTLIILLEVFMDEAGNVCGSDPKRNQYVRETFSTMRSIVLFRRSIYPLGYLFGYLSGEADDSISNLVYILAGFVIKKAFCLAICSIDRFVHESLVGLRPRHGRLCFHPYHPLRGTHG